MITVTVHYYAICRERRGCHEESLCTAAETAAQLFTDLNAKYFLYDDQSCLRVAVNDQLVDWNFGLKQGDQISFIPPVCGG